MSTTLKIFLEWIKKNDTQAPTMSRLEGALDTHHPGVSSVTDAPMATETTRSAMISITPLKIVYPLLDSTFLTPIRAWHLLTLRAMALGCKEALKPFLDWIWLYIWQPAWEIMGPTRVYIADNTLRQCQALAEKIALKLFPPPPPR